MFSPGIINQRDTVPILKPIRGIRLNKTHPLARGLVGLWLFNEGSGNKVFDLSGNGNAGTFEDEKTQYWSGGPEGSTVVNKDGLAADKANYILLGKDLLYGADCFTVIVKLKYRGTDADVNEDTIIVGFDVGERQILTRYDSDNNEVDFYTFTTGQVGGAVLTGVTLADWTVLAFVYDGAKMKCYKNAVLSALDFAQTGAIGEDTDCDYGLSGPYDLERWPNDAGRFEYSYCFVYRRFFSASDIGLLYLKPACMFERATTAFFSIPVTVVAARGRSHVGFKPIEGMNRLRGLGSNALY